MWVVIPPLPPFRGGGRGDKHRDSSRVILEPSCPPHSEARRFTTTERKVFRTTETDDFRWTNGGKKVMRRQNIPVRMWASFLGGGGGVSWQEHNSKMAQMRKGQESPSLERLMGVMATIC